MLMSTEPNVKIPISKTQFLIAVPSDGDSGISVLLVNDYINNFVPSLVGAIRCNNKDYVTLTFINDLRQMRTRITKGETKYPNSHFDFSNSFSVEINNGKRKLVAAPIKDKDYKGLRIFMQSKKHLYPLVEFSVNAFTDTGKVDRVILGREIPYKGVDMLYGNDIIEIAEEEHACE